MMMPRRRLRDEMGLPEPRGASTALEDQLFDQLGPQDATPPKYSTPANYAMGRPSGAPAGPESPAAGPASAGGDATSSRPGSPAAGPADDPYTVPAGRPASYDYIAGSESQRYDASNPYLRGFNTAEWGAGGTEGYDEHSYKNNFGKIASMLGAPNPDAVRSLFGTDSDAAKAFRQTFPRAQLVDHPTDPKIIFEPGDEPVDVLQGTDQGWQWLPEDQQGSAMSGGGGDYDALIRNITGGQGDPLNAILGELGGLAGDGGQTQSILEQLLAEQMQPRV